MSEYFDTLETRDPAEREAQLMQALARQVAHARKFASRVSAKMLA